MSKRIANAYTNFLDYSNRRSASSKSKSVAQSSTTGLLARRNPAQNKSNSKFSEIEKVAQYIDEIRSYRVSNNESQ